MTAEPEPKYQPSPGLGEPEGRVSAPFPNVEPQVDLTLVNGTWWIAFKFHWIFFTICCALLVLYNGYQLYKSYRWRKMMNRNYILIVQTLVIFYGLTRTLALCLSPYELVSNIPFRVPYVVPRLLFGCGFPCLVSGFTFVHKIFLNVSKVQVISRNALGSQLVIIVLVVHFITVLTTEVVTTYVNGTRFLLIICALYYFVGCLWVGLSLLFSGRRVVQKTRKIQASLAEYKTTAAAKNGEATAKTGNKTTTEATSKVTKITAFAAIFGVLCALLYIYTLVWTIRAITGDKSSPGHWSWLIVNTFLRLFELILAATMSYAVGSSYQRGTHTKILVTRCAEID
jgi:hypothetical protein